MCGTVVADATADVEAQVGLEIKLPLPPLPIGPGPLYPLDSYGPRAEDNAAPPPTGPCSTCSRPARPTSGP
jgi:hypothetical protein